jgi:hypothetical protein
MKPLAALLVINAAVFGVWWSILRPQSELLLEARSLLCDGDLDFIMTCDKAGLMVAYSTADFGASASVDVTTQYIYRAVREAVLKGVPPVGEGTIDVGSNVDVGEGFSGSRWTVGGRAELDISMATHLINWDCSDKDMDGSVYWPVLADILTCEGDRVNAGYASITSCSDVAPMCGRDDVMGTRARQFCPSTCGCDDPASELILFGADLGCPLTCVDTPRYAQALGNIECVDWTPGSPVDLIDAYLAGLWQMDWSTELVDGIIEILNMTLTEHGCPGLVSFMETPTADWRFGDLCKSDNQALFRPITAICPVSCGCQQSKDLLCPATC